MTFAVAAGVPIVSVMAILQHTAQEIAVLDSSPIRRPRDLDGRTYAGFGYPNEVPTLQAVIRDDGGTGEFDTVTLDTAAYEALYNKRADFVITFSAWEGVEAAQRGIALRTFKFTDYGFPDFYQVVLACDRGLAGGEPRGRQGVRGRDRARLRARRDEPRRGLRDPRGAEPGDLRREPGAARPPPPGSWPSRGCWSTRDGKVGVQTLDEWTGYSSFLYEQGLLDGRRGQAAGGPAGLRRPVHERLPAVRPAAR